MQGPDTAVHKFKPTSVPSAAPCSIWNENCLTSDSHLVYIALERAQCAEELNGLVLLPKNSSWGTTHFCIPVSPNESNNSKAYMWL